MGMITAGVKAANAAKRKAVDAQKKAAAKARAIAKRKAIQKRTDAKIERERARIDLGVPTGAQTPLKPVGTPKEGIKEKVAGAGAKRPSQNPKFTKKVSPEIKLQREWDGMTPAVRRAERVKYDETGKSKFSVLMKRGSAKTGSKTGKNAKREALLNKLGTFKKGGLAKANHKDLRKKGMFY